jgi:prepilin-type N-terminal cleavage/methylation domain-containing protein/prepilin-type processing-associated H-X9-DG protein
MFRIERTPSVMRVNFRRGLSTVFQGPIRMPHRAFTLVELLVVISIIGLLAGLSMPSILNAMESSRRATCTSNLKNISQSLLLFASENNDWLPSIVTPIKTAREGGGGGVGWMSTLQIAGLLPPNVPYSQSKGKYILMCPSACTAFKPLPGCANTYSMNDYAGGRDVVSGKPSDFGVKLAAIPFPAKFSIVMDGSSTNNVFSGNVNPVSQLPSPVHPPTTNTKDLSVGLNVAFADGHVEMRKKSEIPTASTNVFWTGQN